MIKFVREVSYSEQKKEQIEEKTVSALNMILPDCTKARMVSR